MDDEALLVQVSQRQLEGLGYKVTTTTSSRNALETITASPALFDLLITDQTMPGLTGFELAQAVQKIKADFPVILCTGHRQRMSNEKALQLGIRKFVNKPIIGNELLNSVRSVLNNT